MSDTPLQEESTDFIREIVARDVREGTYGGRVATRFPPEPNGYLHIGHAKAIFIDFGIAEEFGGVCNLRFDDTNPTKEEREYAEAIARDVRWLGCDYGEQVFYASDYFERMYELAEKLIESGKAYVDESTEAEIRQLRGSLTEPGRPSRYRDRPSADSLALFRRMRAGELADGAAVLRAKIDLAAANMKMRDPLLYRIRKAHHDRTGDAWCIYPMYDYAHPLSDAFERITHSLCTLEFENNRELYDWVVRETGVEWTPRQYEFARLAVGYTITSKRKLLHLVKDGHVTGWDDPRMPTIAAMRRRGYTPSALRRFCDLVGVAKHNSLVDIGKLEYALRDDLNPVAPRVMCVLEPLKVVLTNLPETHREELQAPYFPRDIGKEGERAVPFGREIYIERDDFRREPPAKFRRLAPGRTVRLRYGYCITCEDVIEDAQGAVVELRARVHLETTRGANPEGLEVAGVIHWVDAASSLPAEVRLYDRLFTVEKPDAGDDFLSYLNPDSLRVCTGARIERSVGSDSPELRYQFERQGYFWQDPSDSRPEALVFSRIVTLRDSWAAAATQPPAVTVAKSERSKTRPPKRSPLEVRTEARSRDSLLADRFARYQAELGLSRDTADLLTGDRDAGQVFEQAIAVTPKHEAVVNWIINELPRELGSRSLADTALTGGALGALVALVEEGTINAPAGREVLAELVARGGEPAAIVEARGLQQIDDDSALQAMVEEVIAAHPSECRAYQDGKKGLLGFFVGQVMKKSRGKANPQRVQALLADHLDN